MKKVLILALSALLCLTVANSLLCRVCYLAFEGECVEPEWECLADEINGTCKTVRNTETNMMTYFCGTTTDDCNKTEPRRLPFLSPLYTGCCETDFCNGDSSRPERKASKVAGSRGLLETP